MTAKQNSVKNNFRSNSLLPALYKIEYPNCRTGMFSLRTPYKNVSDNRQQTYTDNYNSHIAHPEYLHINQMTRSEQSFTRESLQRDAEVQCSLSSSDVQDRIVIPSQRIFLSNAYNPDELSPVYRVQLQLQPVEPNIYEVWNVETPPPRSIPINQPIKYQEPSIRIRSPRLVNIEPLSDNDSDYEDNLVYTNYPPRMYAPTNVRMVCVRQDTNTICY